MTNKYYRERLSRMKDRRQGALERKTLDEMMMLEKAGAKNSHLDKRKQEVYETLQQSDVIRYVIGSMSEVDEDSTTVSINEGMRVANTLKGLLETSGLPTYIEMQGSVPLNIHIKGHSDVDMLMLIGRTVLVETPLPSRDRYCEPTDKRPMLEQVKELRNLSEEKLTRRYPEATVDCSNAKSIAMSGGSLQRKVDIVPSCWVDTIDYQLNGEKHDRGVEILDKKKDILIGNSPFKHIKLVNDKDFKYGGNLKKCVRLLKTLVADLPEEKKRKAKKLSSFDIVGICYNMNNRLNVSKYTPLALVEALRVQFSILRYIENSRDIMVPDGSRKVLDSEEKMVALGIVHDELVDLAQAIYKDIDPFGGEEYKAKPLQEKQIIV